MAFVYRQERKVFQPQPNKDVGPGTYELAHQKESRLPKAYVPFGSMETRLKQIKAKQLTPGPGTYQIQKQNSSEKVVVSSATQDIKILQVAKPSSIFKSNTKRFNQSQTPVPGPGQYYKQKINYVNQNQNSAKIQDYKPKIIQHLIKINKYQSIPSIPSNTQAYGYNQNQKNQLQLNQPPIQIITGQKYDKVGPGQYNIQLKTRKKGISWQNSKTSRLLEEKVNVNVGPGSYQLKPMVPVFRYKQTPQFASKSERGMYQRKGAISQKVIKNKIPMETTQSRMTSDKAPQSTNIDDDEQYEYVDDSTPGPGSYLQISQSRTLKPGKSTHFGSSTKRFPQLQKIRNPVGPGSYQIQMNVKSKSAQKKKIPLGGSHQRFQEPIEASTIPGPGSYQPRNTLEDRLIYKIQKGYRGQFGSTQERFRQPQIQKVGPGFYQIKLNEGPNGTTAPFKSKINKIGFIKSNLNPPPGSYNLNYYDLSKNIIQQQQQDPDLIIKKPGFNVGTQRFKQQTKKQDPFEQEQMINQILTKAKQEKKQKKNITPFNSKQERPVLKKIQVTGPGPGMYETNEDKWNKRTFNILFADI